MARLDTPSSLFAARSPAHPPTRGSLLPGSYFPRVELILSTVSFSNPSPASSYVYAPAGLSRRGPSTRRGFSWDDGALIDHFVMANHITRSHHPAIPFSR
jgi:hypothetical protein